jgi:transposase-like protein
MKPKRFKKILFQVDDFNSDQFRRLKETLKAHELKNKHGNSLLTIIISTLPKFRQTTLGKKKRHAALQCKQCRKTYNSLSSTPLARLRKKEQWLDYSACLISGLSLRKAAAK